jgi:hypothetical protein
MDPLDIADPFALKIMLIGALQAQLSAKYTKGVPKAYLGRKGLILVGLVNLTRFLQVNPGWPG